MHVYTDEVKKKLDTINAHRHKDNMAIYRYFYLMFSLCQKTIMGF